MAGPSGNADAGQIVLVSQAAADTLIAAGFAELVDLDPAPETAAAELPETATAPAPKPRKRAAPKRKKSK